jgi:F0F1-type ATP synthase assembly protein I
MFFVQPFLGENMKMLISLFFLIVFIRFNNREIEPYLFGYIFYIVYY